MPLRQPPRIQPVAVHESLRTDQRHVRPAALDEAEVAERADLRVAEDEQHRVARQQAEHRVRVPLCEIAARTVVHVPVGRHGIRDHAGARQRRGSGSQPRLRAPRGRQAVQQELRAHRHPQRGEAVTDEGIRAEDRDVVRVEVEPEQRDQHGAVPHEHRNGARGAHDSRGPPAAQQHPQAERGQRAARGRHLPQQLRAEPAEKRQPVCPSRAGTHVHVGIAAAADVMPERPPIVDRAVEADERLLPRAHHHPRVRQARAGERDQGEPRQLGKQPPARRQGRGQQAGGRQHHERPMVGQAETVRRRGARPRPPAFRMSHAVQDHRVRGEERQGVERIDFGDDRLRPEMLRRAEQPRRSQRRQPRCAQQAGAGIHPAARQRPERRAGHVAQHRGAAERKLHEQVAEQRVERIAGRVGDAEMRPRHQEQAVVFQHDGARQRQHVQHERAEHGRGASRALRRSGRIHGRTLLILLRRGGVFRRAGGLEGRTLGRHRRTSVTRPAASSRSSTIQSPPSASS